ncbi:MAG: cation:proton antiporter subunit C [Desulfobacterales bacterium]|jgi:multicomponent Na+:H+ antiporter subunit C|nr:cation:proton antiporter subunit C [Desulfobacteraceae bacterium]MDD3990769.1 cation:proton antiporter subunit C [Desulfobacteraceae bacterium]MDY0310540.1 cation:proton antiporter subunit C [Desulfobacterales bacterium]
MTTAGYINLIIAKYNYWIYIVLMCIGLWAMIAKRNLIKKIIGMNILQTAIILFYVSIATKKGATLPILGHHDAGHFVDYATVINPLPHVLMLTAIVVSVATLGVALALAMKIYNRYDTLEEDEIHARVRES